MKKEDLKSFLWTLALIGFIRGFIVEPFKIPSGSMIPTLLIGDHLFVAKASYDIGIPFTTTKLFKVSDPKRGDVVVFRYPNHENDQDKVGQHYIKRILGIPGDTIEIRNGLPVINGTPVVQEKLDPAIAEQQRFTPGHKVPADYNLYKEFIPGREAPHWVERNDEIATRTAEYVDGFTKAVGRDCLPVAQGTRGHDADYDRLVAMNSICPFTLPPDQYFAMGDNRDQSADGREWGFFDRSLLKGRALFIWMSFGGEGLSSFSLRWNRLGLAIN